MIKYDFMCVGNSLFFLQEIITYKITQCSNLGSLCHTMACFERNLHNEISGGGSVKSTTFCGNQAEDTTFLFHDPL